MDIAHRFALLFLSILILSFSGCTADTGATPVPDLVSFEAEVVEHSVLDGLPFPQSIRFDGNRGSLELPDGTSRNTFLIEWEGNWTALIHVDQDSLEPLAIQESGSSLVRLVRFDLNSVLAFSWLIPWKASIVGVDGDFIFLGHEGSLKTENGKVEAAFPIQLEGESGGRLLIEIELARSTLIAESVHSTISEGGDEWSKRAWGARVDAGLDRITLPTAVTDLDPVGVMGERQQWDGLPPTGESAGVPFDPNIALGWAQEDSLAVKDFIENNPGFWANRAVYTEQVPVGQPDTGPIREWTMSLKGDGEGIGFTVEWYAPAATEGLPSAIHQTTGVSASTGAQRPEDLAAPHMVPLAAAFSDCRSSSPYIDLLYEQVVPFTEPIVIGGITQWAEAAYVCPQTWRMDAVTGHYLAFQLPT